MEITGAGQFPSPKVDKREQVLRKAAETLEASFVAKMLEAAGMGKTSESFGGGPGEDQFSSFLLQEQANEIVKAGGFGLAESIFNALKDREK